MNLPAPCIIDVGTLVRKRDMHRVLSDLGRVTYQEIRDGQIVRSGEGYVMEVFADLHSATLIANAAIYLNVHSFDCLALGITTHLDREQPFFDLIQENRVLRLLPLSSPLQDPPQRLADAQALKIAMLDWLNQNMAEGDEDCPDGFFFN
ncbi:MAG: hypothetical protein Q6L49_08370 [Thermostichales cyanobacterium HHBFW_bins_127]